MIFTAAHSKQVLTVEKNGTNDGAKIVQEPYKKLKSQEFRVKNKPNGKSTIEPVHTSGKCLDVYGGRVTKGTIIIMVILMLTPLVEMPWR